MYLCYTKDKHFSPLTGLDVLAVEGNVVREPFWSGVRAVRDSGASVDAYSNVNSGAGGVRIYVMQTRREIV